MPAQPLPPSTPGLPEPADLAASPQFPVRPLLQAAPPGHGGAFATDPGPLFGRAAEIERITTCINNLHRRIGSIVLVHGEAGIGKTSLASRIAIHAASQGHIVGWTRGLEGDWLPPYHAWIDLLTQTVQAVPDLRHAPDPPPWIAPLTALVPIFQESEYFPTVAPAPSLGTQADRFRLTDAFTQGVLDLARRSSIVLILDDIQWCDPDSLHQLRHLGNARRTVPLLVVALFRNDPEFLQVRFGHPLGEVVHHLRRDPQCQELALGGLDPGAVAALMAATAPNRTGSSGESGGDGASTSQADLIHAYTRGNPFFVQELTRYLDLEGELGTLDRASAPGTLPIPDSLRQVIERRLERLSPPSRRMLQMAPACSDTFDSTILATLTGLDDDALLDAIDEALDARLIVAAPGDHARDRYEFQHAIVRRTLYDGLNPSRRVRLHRQLAIALQQGSTPAVHDLVNAEIAGHYHRSRSLSGADAGIPYALAAADLAADHKAPEHAVALLHIAQDLAVGRPPGEQVAIQSRLALTEAQAFQLDRAIASTHRTVQLFRDANAPPGEIARFLAQAVTALHDGGADASEWMSLVSLGRALVPPDDEQTWAHLTLMLSRFEPISVGIVTGSRWLGSDARAVAIAQSSGDEDLFARSLQPWDLWDRAWTEELCALVATWSSPGAIIRAQTICGADWLYHHGDFFRARAHFEGLNAIAVRHGSVPGQAEAQVRLALLHTIFGDLDRALDTREIARTHVSRLGANHRLRASLIWVDAAIAELDGSDWSHIAAFLSRHVSDPQTGQATITFDDAALLAYALARDERPAEAAVILEALTRLLDQLEPTLWLMNGTVCFAASAIWEMRGTVHAAFAAPFFRAAQAILPAHGDFPGISIHLSIARMATMLGRYPDAERAFSQARDHLAHTGQHPLRARVDLDEAQALLERPHGDGDLKRAARLADDAHTAYAELGLPVWTERASDVAARIAERPSTSTHRTVPAGLTPREIDVVCLVARGLSDRQISEQMFVSTRTVHAHIRNILAKTGLANRTGLSVWAVEQGIHAAS